MEATQVPEQAGAPEGIEASETVSEQPKPQTYRLKVNGKEVEKTIDEILGEAQKGIAADERFQEAASLAKKYKQYEQLDRAMQQGNLSFVIDKLGHDKFRQFAENYLIDYLEYEQLPPEKKEALQYKRRAEELQAKLQEQEASKKEAEVAQARSQALAEIDQEISEVLKNFNRKPTPYLVARIAEQMLASLQSRDVDPKSVTKSAYERAVKSLDNDVGEYLANMSVDDARRVLPKHLLDALRKADVEAVRAQDPMRSRQQSKTQEKASKPGQKVRMSTDEFFKQKIEKALGA